MREKVFSVYMMANRKDGVIYTGVTSYLQGRDWQHKNKAIDGFTKKYNVNKLIYYEVHGCAESAIMREKRLKKYKRIQKIRLIEKENPEWRDLSKKINA